MPEEIKKWKELSRETIFEKFGRGVEKVNFELQEGQVGDFYIKKEGATVATLAITEDGKVILAKQFRPGPQEIFNELPGGYIDEGENPKEAGERELLEETGYAGEAVLVGKSSNCGYSTIEKNCVVVTNCKKVASQELEKNEFVQIVLMPLADFRKSLSNGKMTDLQLAYMGLDYLDLL